MSHLTMGVERSVHRVRGDPVLWGAAGVGLVVSLAIVHPLTMMIAALASQACVAGIATVWDIIGLHLREEFARPMRPMTAVFAVMGAGVSGALAWTSLRVMRQRYTVATDSRVRPAVPDLLPICAWCQKVRDEQGEWRRIERYLADRVHVQCSHHVCPECADTLLEDANRAEPPGARQEDEGLPTILGL